MPINNAQLAVVRYPVALFHVLTAANRFRDKLKISPIRAQCIKLHTLVFCACLSHLALNANTADWAFTTNQVFVGGWRVVSGTASKTDDASWQEVRGEVESVLSSNAAVVRRIKMVMNPSGGGAGNIPLRPTYHEEFAEPFAIINLRQTPTIGARVKEVARRSGVTNQGHGNVYDLWDCGRPYTMTVIRSNLVLDAAERALETNSRLRRVVAYQQKNASNGLANAQYELGMRYLRGDGVETNLQLATHWLRAACTNGESRASNALSKISAP